MAWDIRRNGFCDKNCLSVRDCPFHVIPLDKSRERTRQVRIVRYSKEIPGERVQLDVMKVRNGAYQFTAIDDCTRLRTIRVYPNKKAENTIHFLGEILNTFPFPVQRIQTDWGTEFFNYDFQYELHDILSSSDQSNQRLRIWMVRLRCKSSSLSSTLSRYSLMWVKKSGSQMKKSCHVITSILKS